jgi:Cu-Zn family superoxide dismutase
MRRTLLAVTWVGFILSGCAAMVGDELGPPALSAGATLKDKDGKQVGVATLIQTDQGVRVAVTGHRLPPGPKGLHIHETGVCQPPEFTSAGGHFNPHGKKHGRMSPEGPHAGDLPNLVASAAGEGGVDVVNSLITLRPGQPNSLVGGKGTAIVIHAGPDDEKTDPTGNSGGRIACGVIAKD